MTGIISECRLNPESSRHTPGRRNERIRLLTCLESVGIAERMLNSMLESFEAVRFADKSFAPSARHRSQSDGSFEEDKRTTGTSRSTSLVYILASTSGPSA